MRDPRAGEPRALGFAQLVLRVGAGGSELVHAGSPGSYGSTSTRCARSYRGPELIASQGTMAPISMKPRHRLHRWLKSQSRSPPVSLCSLWRRDQKLIMPVVSRQFAVRNRLRSVPYCDINAAERPEPAGSSRQSERRTLCARESMTLDSDAPARSEMQRRLHIGISHRHLCVGGSVNMNSRPRQIPPIASGAHTVRRLRRDSESSRRG